MIAILYALSVGILGIFAGAQIAEAVLLVPYWKSIKPSAFFQFYKNYGKSIYQFFAPLTIAATVFPVGTAIYTLISNQGNQLLAILLAFFTLAFFSTFYLYFKKANASFTNGSLSEEALPKELKRWGNWHWTRICFELAALICAIIGLMSV